VLTESVTWALCRASGTVGSFLWQSKCEYWADACIAEAGKFECADFYVDALDQGNPECTVSYIHAFSMLKYITLIYVSAM
jgi:hypothetical protein